MALAALSAVAVFDVNAATAEAAPSESQFAGTYVGRDPLGWHLSWAITISNRGRIESSYSYADGSNGSISGRISTDGSYSLAVSTAIYVGKDRYGREGTKSGWVKSSYTIAGSMALDADGNLVGTAGDSRSFTWLRR